ncbi:MAG: tetratricopeptide repeat protein, partial [Solirubrobacteraceae bacterium]
LEEVRGLIAEAAPGDVATVGRLRTEAGHALLEWGRLVDRPALLEEALAELDRAGSGPDAAPALEMAGTALTELGRYEEALARFAAVAGEGDSAPGALLGMGKVYLLLGESSEALGAFARLLQACPERDSIGRWARAGRALALRRLGDTGAERAAERALKRSDDAVSYVERGTRHEFFGALDDAERDFRTAVGLAPKWGAAHHVLARNLVERAGEREVEPDVRVARLEEACRLATVAIERHRTGAAEPHYRHTAGRAYLRLGRSGEAIEHMREAARINPGHVGIREDLHAAEQAAQVAPQH